MGKCRFTHFLTVTDDQQTTPKNKKLGKAGGGNQNKKERHHERVQDHHKALKVLLKEAIKITSKNSAESEISKT